MRDTKPLFAIIATENWLQIFAEHLQQTAEYNGVSSADYRIS